MSVTKDFNINLDLYEPLDNEKFTVVEGDTANMLHIHVLGNGEPVDLTGCKILVIFAKGGQPVEQDSDGNGVTVSGDDNNIIDVELYSSSYTNGENTAQVQILSGDGYSLLATTAAFNFNGEKALANEDTLLSTIQWPLLMVALDKLDDIARGVQADMEIADDTDPAFVKNKPDIPTEPSDIGAADATHAARHASGGDDPITPQSIGALPDTATAVDIGALPDTTTPDDIGAAALDGNGKVETNQDSLITVVKDTSWTLVLTDADHKMFQIETNAITVTVPLNATVDMPVGVIIPFTCPASGSLTFAADSGVTLLSVGGNMTIAEHPSAACLMQLTTDTWLLTGCDS